MARLHGMKLGPPHGRDEGDFSVRVREFYDVIFRHKAKIVTFFLATVLGSLFFILTSPEYYESTAQALVKRGRESMTVDPTAATGRIVAMHQTWENILNSELAILSSPEIARMTVDKIGEDVVLNGLPQEERDPSPFMEWLSGAQGATKGFIKSMATLPLRLVGWSGPDLSARDEAIQSVYEGVDFKLLRKSSIIAFSYQRGNPELAQHVLSAFIDSYLEKHIEVYRTQGTYTFFQQQGEEIQKALKDIERQLGPLKSRVTMSSIQGQRDLIIGRINRLLDSIDQAETTRAASEARVNAIRRLQPDLGDPGMAPTRTTALLPTGREEYNEIKLEYLEHESDLAASKAEVATYRSQLEAAYRELEALDDADLIATDQKIRELEREKALLEAKYQAYFDSLEQIRVEEALENEKISNISIVQPATLAMTPVNASKTFQLLLALLIGVVGGIGLAFLAERFDQSLRTPDSVEGRLHVPTLASVPLLSKKELNLSKVSQNGRVPGTARNIYEGLRDRLLLASGNSLDPPVVIGVTSCRQDEGVTTTASNLAVSLASDGDYTVLLIDGAFHDPTLHTMYDVPLGPGLYELLDQGAASIRQVSDRLHVLTAGEAPDDLPKSFLPERHDQLLKYLRDGGYHMAVIDMPPVSEGSSTARLAGQIDGVVLVAESEKIRWQVAANATRQLEDSQANLMGVVLNKRRFYVPEWLYARL